MREVRAREGNGLCLFGQSLVTLFIIPAVGKSAYDRDDGLRSDDTCYRISGRRGMVAEVAVSRYAEGSEQGLSRV